MLICNYCIKDPDHLRMRNIMKPKPNSRQTRGMDILRRRSELSRDEAERLHTEAADHNNTGKMITNMKCHGSDILKNG